MVTPIEKLTLVARRLHGRLTFAAILQTLVDGAADLLDAPRANLRLLDPSRSRLLAVCRSGSALHLGPAKPFSLGEGLLGWIAEQAQPLRLGDAQQDRRFVTRPNMKEPMGSFLGVPLMAGATCMGVLSAVHPDHDFFDEQHEHLLMLLAAIAAPHVEIARLARLMRVDSLTGTLNRRGLETAFPEVSNSGSDVANPLCLAMVDIDEFKRINDHYGHAVGDEVLKTVSDRIGAVLRSGDAVVRYGGEEFLLIMPSAPLPDAARVAERARAAVWDQPVAVAGSEIGMSISVGVAERLAGEGREELIERADKAMYAAKHAGRNRVELAR